MADRTYEKRGGIYPVVGKDGKQAKDKEGKPRWIVQAFAGMVYNSETRRPEPRVVTKRFAGTKTEAKRVKLELENEAQMMPNLSNRNMTLDEFVPLWVEDMKQGSKGRKPSEKTVQRNIALLEHVAKYIGGMPMRKIDQATIVLAMAEMEGDKSLAGGKGLSGTTMNMVFRQLKNVFELAYDWDYIPKNPCKRVTPPSKDGSDRRSLTVEECKRLSNYVNSRIDEEVAEFESKEGRMQARGKGDDRRYVKGVSPLSSLVMVKLALNTGARRGELLALTWDCVHLDGVPYIDIKKSLTVEKVVKAPKTESSTGSVSFDAETAEKLRLLRSVQDEYMPSFIVGKSDDKRPVFCDDRGGYYDPNHFSRWWRRFRDEAGFEGLRFHELRHTVGTRLESAGVPIVEIQKRLRHAKASTTYDYYCHKDDGLDPVASKVMSEICGTEEKSERKKPVFKAIAC